MQSLKDWQNSKRFRALAYAPSGDGKTFGAGTFPRPCFFDFDHGIATLRNPAFVAKWGQRDIIYEQFEEKDFTKGGVVTKHRAFDAAFLFYEDMMKNHKDEFDTWVVDSATFLSEVALNKALIFMGQQSPKLSNTQETAVTQGVVIPKIQDYGAERSLVEQFIGLLLATDKNVLVLCHEKELYDDGGNLLGRVPLLTGKSTASVCAMFDEVYHVEKHKKGPETKYIIMTELPGKNMAKSRLGIPNGTEWNWPAIEAELKRIHASQAPTPAASALTR